MQQEAIKCRSFGNPSLSQTAKLFIPIIHKDEGMPTESVCERQKEAFSEPIKNICSQSVYKPSQYSSVRLYEHLDLRDYKSEDCQISGEYVLIFDQVYFRILPRLLPTL